MTPSLEWVPDSGMWRHIQTHTKQDAKWLIPDLEMGNLTDLDYWLARFYFCILQQNFSHFTTTIYNQFSYGITEYM